ncbi:MAG: hypothetical protein HYX69_06950 [Planctomycetia bacterium]|nr:hypothetical protein [Planctomycetia bacterium]
MKEPDLDQSKGAAQIRTMSSTCASLVPAARPLDYYGTIAADLRCIFARDQIPALEDLLEHLLPQFDAGYHDRTKDPHLLSLIVDLGAVLPRIGGTPEQRIAAARDALQGGRGDAMRQAIRQVAAGLRRKGRHA